VKIKSTFFDYEVEFSEALSDCFLSLQKKIEQDQAPCLFVIDQNLKSSLANLMSLHFPKASVFWLTATETNKSIKGATEIWQWLQTKSAHRKTKIIAIGGGITQDLSAFTAHLYYRGVDWFFVPTTLLSQWDSCIGSKYALNLMDKKNQIGNYHPPSHVFLCTEFLKTLPEVDLYSGLGEGLRLAWTGGDQEFAQFCLRIENKDLRNIDFVTCIKEGLQVKKKIIEVDEREQDLRKILNYGHSFGHAIESNTDHAIPHGLAVVLGMQIIDHISETRGFLTSASRLKKSGVTKKAFNKVLFHNQLINRQLKMLDADKLISTLKSDKKATDSEIQLILNAGAGALKIVKTKIDAELKKDLQSALSKTFELFEKGL
jgi:3-dehydroquinate synthase